MRPEICILIADDHPIFRSGLKQVIESTPHFKIVGEAADGRTALALIESLQPAVAVLDINMPELDGLEVLREVRQKRLAGEFVFLTMHDDEPTFNKAMSLGVRGYVLKDSATTDILNCLNAIVAGQSYTSPALTAYLLKRSFGSKSPAERALGLDALSPTERNILRLIAEYKTSKEIADELCMHFRTVENYRSQICTKLNLHGSHALIKFALKHQKEL
jgi:DNA-binding NarL/FixJ family response regulator